MPDYYDLAPKTLSLDGVDVTVADTEYSFTFPKGTRRFEFRYRAAADLRFSDETGKVAGPTDTYITLPSGQGFDSGPAAVSDALTIYFASSTGSSRVEIIYWS